MYVSPFFAPIVILILSLPLFLKLVPRNPIFGLRTRDTMSSDNKWYAANRVVGAAGILGGLVWLILSAVLPQFGVRAGYITIAGLAVVIAATLSAANRVR